MKILVTGAYGQLGSELKELADDISGHQFLFTDADTLNIADEKQVRDFFEKEKPEFVINCAAYTAVDKAETEMEAAQKVNDSTCIAGKIYTAVQFRFYSHFNRLCF